MHLKVVISLALSSFGRYVGTANTVPTYREPQEMLAELGVNMDHTTIYRWVQRYAPEIEKRLRWYWCNPSDLNNCHLDETYLKVNGKWAYLYRAIDSRGHAIEFYLSPRRNTKAAYRFLRKIFN